MKRDTFLKFINTDFPRHRRRFDDSLRGLRHILFLLRGTFLGVDLKVIGILFMDIPFALTLPPVSRTPNPSIIGEG